MLEQDFMTDSISSDVHQLSIDGPAFDILVTMSKFLCFGMPLGKIIASSTCIPARAIGRQDLGTLGVDRPGDAAVLSIQEGQFEYRDVTGDTFLGKQRLVAEQVVVGGKIWQK